MASPLRQLMGRGKAWLKRRLEWAAPRATQGSIPYSHWMNERLNARRTEYPAVAETNLFSILTPVFDPPAAFLRELSASIFAQDHADWQWVLVDNGCRNAAVLKLLDRISRDQRVTLVRADRPRGIIGGMRLALEHARGRYVCAVDHDDWLYPDALRVVAAYLQAARWPALAYTDEDKLLPSGRRDYPFLKPDWDPLLFLNCCYVAHLGVMDRMLALKLGVYSDAGAEGTPDGDAFCRFVAAGHVPLHIPEVVYSWRMHADSTALRGVEAKPYVIAGQRHALNRYLERTGLSERVELRTNPLPGIPGIWRVAPPVHPDAQNQSMALLLKPGGKFHNRQQLLERLALCSRIQSIEQLDSSPHNLLDCLESRQDAEWVMVLDPHHLPLTTDFVSEMQCVRDAVSDAVVVGGTVLDRRGIIRSAGLAWGFAGLLGSPLAGCAGEDIQTGAGAMTLQRCATGVDTQCFAANVGFLRTVLSRYPLDAHHPLLSAWLAAEAQRAGKRILFTPYARFQQFCAALPRAASAQEQFQWISVAGEWLRHERYYPGLYSHQKGQAYQLATPSNRRVAISRWISQLAGTHSDWQEHLPDQRMNLALIIARQEVMTTIQMPNDAYRRVG